MLPAILTVGSLTMFSRVFGLARDMLLAAFLGTGPVAQAFLVAFTLPNMFRRFFAEGAFNVAFVPMFSKRVEAGEDAMGFARDALSALASLLILFTLVAQLLMPWLVLALASGFAGDERFDIAVIYGRIAFPYILFISLMALMSGVLNSLGRFAVAAAAPVLMNIVMIVAMLLGYYSGGNVGDWLIWSVPIAGIAQFLTVWIGAAKAGFAVMPRWPRLTPEIKHLATIAWPAAITASVTQVNLIIGRQVGSFFDGAVAWLSYADRVFHLPIGVAGVAINVVLVPDLARRLRANDVTGSRHAANRALEFALIVTLPATLALVVIPEPIISVLFERGAFDAADTRATSIALLIFGLGLPAFILQRVLLPIYYVREDTKAPLRFAINALVVNAVIAVGLAPVLGFTAAAIGPAASAWAMLLQLWLGTRKMGVAAEGDERLFRALPRIALASAGMAIVLFFANNALDGPLHDAVWKYAALAILVGIGGVSYGALLLLSGAVRPADIKSALRRSG